jgi:hypothetical protein
MASVTFKRTNNIDSVPIVDGQLIFDASDQKIYLDNGNTREVYGGGSGTDLISNVSDATDNNAFNANATVNLFTRKSSIVDTKAEIQSVTQAGVPLGCKGFNEVIGTGDISELGDGSVTGAILANKSAIDTVNQNLTTKVPIWNPTDDYYYVNGKRSIKAWLNSVDVWVNGVFGIDIANGQYNFSGNYPKTSFAVNGNLLQYTGASASTTLATLVSENLIDFTNYSHVYVKTNSGNIDMNVSEISGQHYLCFIAGNTNGAGIAATALISDTKEGFGYYPITQSGLQTAVTTISINEITIE